MSSLSHHFGVDIDGEALPEVTGQGPVVEQTYWGYVIHDQNEANKTGMLAAIGGRFFGVILLMAAAGLWIMPDALVGPEVFAMKLGAMVMFTVFGGYLVWAGRSRGASEFQVDTARGELRFGSNTLRGDFRLHGRLSFRDVASIYLLRSKDRSLPTRLFLRIGDGERALEIASGAEEQLEILRQRLTHDLTRPTREVLPLETQLERHAVFAT